jgi:hypothetical protein
MKCEPTCPRCGRPVRPPGLWSSDWECSAHGPVAPLQGVRTANDATLDVVLSRTRVPVWLPWALPSNWVVTGFADAGDDRSGAVAVAVALSGPAPVGGMGEMVVVAEEPGTGLAARLAELPGPDVGPEFDAGPVSHKLRFAGHEVHLWRVPTGDAVAAYAGEALACWLWFVMSPADTGLIMPEVTALRDLRERGDGDVALTPPYGALSPFLDARLAARE